MWDAFTEKFTYIRVRTFTLRTKWDKLYLLAGDLSIIICGVTSLIQQVTHNETYGGGIFLFFPRGDRRRRRKEEREKGLNDRLDVEIL